MSQSKNSYLTPTDITVTSTNPEATAIQNVRNLETTNAKVFAIVYTLKSYTLPTSFDNTLFTNPKYMEYRSSLNYTNYVYPLFDTQKVALSSANSKSVSKSFNEALADVNNTAVAHIFTAIQVFDIPITQNMVMATGGTVFTVKNAFAHKIYAYITINTAGIYKIASSDTIRIFLNNYLVFTNTSGDNQISKSSDIYLNTGTYFVYIEKMSLSNDKVLNITLDLATRTTSTSIDTYLSPYYTPLTTAITSRDNSLINFCDTGNNLYETNNICNTSLTNTPLLNNTLINKCIPNKNVLTKDSKSQKMDTNCLAVYNRSKTSPSTLNSTIKNNFDTAYDAWATNVAITNNNIKDATNDNVEALAEYLNIRTPTETQFGFPTNIQNYCETNVNEYDVLTSSNNLCKNQYTRTYTDATNNYDKTTSIQNIKNKFCNPNLNSSNITNTKCTSEYNKSNSFLGDEWAKYCFGTNPTRNPTVPTTGLSEDCRNLFENTNTHSIIKNKISVPWSNGEMIQLIKINHY